MLVLSGCNKSVDEDVFGTLTVNVAATQREHYIAVFYAGDTSGKPVEESSLPEGQLSVTYHLLPGDYLVKCSYSIDDGWNIGFSESSQTAKVKGGKETTVVFHSF